ncbi:MAG: DUF1580 domain-containing protein [Phycisphaerae bacterium]|nr:DUF1580 domain-containing protein [Phycisphaerae bacterium]
MTRKDYNPSNDSEALLALSAAAKRCPGRPNTSTLWRWARKGIKARSGPRIRLEHVRVGGKIYVTLDSLNRFFKKVASADMEYFEKQSEARSHLSEYRIRKPIPRNRREKEIEKAETFLREEGI